MILLPTIATPVARQSSWHVTNTDYLNVFARWEQYLAAVLALMGGADNG